MHTVARLSRLIQTEGSPVLQAKPGGLDNQLARLEVKWLKGVEHGEKMGLKVAAQELEQWWLAEERPDGRQFVLHGWFPGGGQGHRRLWCSPLLQLPGTVNRRVTGGDVHIQNSLLPLHLVLRLQLLGEQL